MWLPVYNANSLQMQTFALRKAFKLAKAMETAEKDSKGLQVDKTREMTSPAAVYAVSNLVAGKR